MKLPEPGTLQLLLITIAVTAVVGAMFKPAGEAILKALIAPFKPVLRLLYLWIAPRNILSIPLLVYKRAIRRSHLAMIETPVGPGLEIPLDHAFAPLKLVSKAHGEGVELFSMTESNHRLLILGGPGSGKTALMKSLLLCVGQTDQESFGRINPRIRRPEEAGIQAKYRGGGHRRSHGREEVSQGQDVR